MSRKSFVQLIAAALLVAGPALAQSGPPPVVPAEAPAEPDAIPLYGDATPGTAVTEDWGRYGGREYGVRNVTRPTITPFLPDPDRATGAAVIVLPGGAFMGLAIEHEGWKVAEALAERGIAAFVLKYRLIETPKDEAEAGAYIGQRMMQEVGNAANGSLVNESKAPEDAIAALALVRAHAEEFGIDPDRVGMIGFSAGAMTSLRVALNPDAANRPDFFGYIYGPQDAVEVPTNAPPMFDAIAWDDSLFPTNGFPIAEAWNAADRPVELHAYQTGDHGFGLGWPGTTNTLLADEFVLWMRANGWLGGDE